MNTNAQSAAMPKRLLGFAWLGFSARFRGRGISGRVPITETTPKPAGEVPMPDLSLEVLIHQRAERVCNRNRDLVARYIRQQTILGRGRS